MKARRLPGFLRLMARRISRFRLLNIMDLLQKYALIIAKNENIFQVGILFLKKVPHLSKIFVYIHHRNLSRNVANFNQKRQISESCV